MKNAIPLLLGLLLFSGITSAQNEWRHRGCFPSTPRRSMPQFSLGNYGYIVGGYDDATGVVDKEVWRYDPNSDTWTQMNDYPHIQNGASYFIINDTAYVGLGFDEIGDYFTDFYRYDVPSDSWISIADFPGVPRYFAMAFGFSGRGYVGCGKGAGQNNDFYQYNPQNNTWTQKASFPGTARQGGLGVANSSIAIMGYGWDGSFFSDLYSYSPDLDQWTPINSYAPNGRAVPSSFVINDTIYTATGDNATADYTDCWRYDVPSGTWIQEPGFACIAPGRSMWAGGFAINGHGYFYGGNNNSFADYNDLLEFGPHDTAFVKRVHILGNDTSYCGNFNRVLSTGNPCTVWSTGAIDSQIVVTTPGTYWAYWADTCGQVIDTIHIAAGGGLLVNLGPDTGICSLQSLVLNAGNAGAAYSWSTGATTQTISVNMAGTYSVTVSNGQCDVSASVVISNLQLRDTVYPINASCSLNNGYIQAEVLNGDPPYSYSWNNNATSSAISNLAPGTYNVTCSDAAGCSATASATITSTGAPSVSITSPDTVICPGDTAEICATGGFASYAWNTGDTGVCIFTPFAGNYYVTVSAGANCTAASNQVVITERQPLPVTVSVNGDTLTCYPAVSYQWYLNGNIIPGDTSDMIIAWQTGVYIVKVLDSYGCYDNSSTINITGIVNINLEGMVSIYPNPVAQGGWTLEVDEALIGSQAEIFDATGKLVFKTVITAAKEKPDIQLAKGIYTLLIRSVNGFCAKKLVKL